MVLKARGYFKESHPVLEKSGQQTLVKDQRVYHQYRTSQNSTWQLHARRRSQVPRLPYSHLNLLLQNDRQSSSEAFYITTAWPSVNLGSCRKSAGHFQSGNWRPPRNSRSNSGSYTAFNVMSLPIGAAPQTLLDLQVFWKSLLLSDTLSLSDSFCF